MDVYYNGNGNIWNRGRQSKKLTAIPIQQTFLWEEQEILIPALYTGQAGAILDVCIKISRKDTDDFFQKWSEERRLSLNSQEDFEKMDADNPCSIHFETELRLDEQPLINRMWESLAWYPKDIVRLEEWGNDKDAEKLMEAYGCDRNFCWYFCRCVYAWNKEAILAPQKLSIVLKEMPKPFSAAHFTTNLSCQNKKIKMIHPQTRQEYTLTLHKCEKTDIPFPFPESGIRYPCFCQTLSYSISPEPKSGLFDVWDCANGDSPRKKEDAAPKANHSDVIGESCGPVAFFAAGNSHEPGKYAAVSSCYFHPPENIRWRAVFQIKSKADMEICLSPIPYR